MANKPNTTRHVSIGLITISICGLNTQHGQYNIALFQKFFVSPPEEQCARCLKLLRKHGYNIEKLRLHYREITEKAKSIEDNGVSQAMHPYLKQARDVIANHA